MINLIPPQAKKSLMIEYWVRVASTWLILWSITLIVSTIILLPTYVLIGTQVSVYKTSAEEASLKVASYKDVSRSLVNASQRARILVDESGLADISEFITLIEGLQGSEVELSQINLNRIENGFDPMIVSGTAADRQALASFRDRLLAEEKISSVDLPISNLARDKDIQFTITVNLKPTDV
jgi:hypothetical protein